VVEARWRIMSGLIPKTLLVTLGCLAAADVAGAIACTIFDILPLRGVSPALAYAIWLVFGIFCGLFSYNIAGAWASPKGGADDWSARPGASRLGTGILVTSALVVIGLAGLFYVLIWREGGGDEYVPDSMPHSIVFFLAVLGGVGMGRFMLMSDAAKPY
jgi:hypothetical protein